MITGSVRKAAIFGRFRTELVITGGARARSRSTGGQVQHGGAGVTGEVGGQREDPVAAVCTRSSRGARRTYGDKRRSPAACRMPGCCVPASCLTAPPRGR